MSVTSEQSSISYDGNNSSVSAYSVPFDFLLPNDLGVSVTLKSTGVATILSYGSQFTVTGGEGGGAVVTTAAWSNLYTVEIFRDLPFTQLDVFEEGQRIPMKMLEAGFDRMVMQIQRAWAGIAGTAEGLAAHILRTDNPHVVTKAQVGLANTDNTSDVNKPISTATAAALATKANLLGGNSFTGQQTHTISGNSGTAVRINATSDSYEDEFIEITKTIGGTPTQFFFVDFAGVYCLGNIEAGGDVLGANLSGNNSGDQDLSGYGLLGGTQTWTGSNIFQNATFNDFIEFTDNTDFNFSDLAKQHLRAVLQPSILGAEIFVTETTTARTLTDADNGKVIVCTNGSDVTITLNNGLVPYFSCTILQKGTGVATIGGLAGREVFAGYLAKTAGQHAQMSVANYGITNTYHVGGQLGS